MLPFILPVFVGRNGLSMSCEFGKVTKASELACFLNKRASKWMLVLSSCPDLRLRAVLTSKWSHR